MNDTSQAIEHKNIHLLNDDETPFDFVIELLRSIFSKSQNEAEKIAKATDRTGKGLCGTYPSEVADVLLTRARQYITDQSQPLKLASENVVKNTAVLKCGFCGKFKDQVKHLISGKDTYICDACVLTSTELLRENLAEKRFTYAYEMLNWHFGNIAEEQIITSSRFFPARVRVDLQLSIDSLLSDGVIKFIGIHNDREYEQLTMATLLKKGRQPKMIGPIQREDVDIGEDTPVKCLANGLWILKESDVPYAVLVTKNTDYTHQKSGITIEAAAPAGEEASKITEKFFKTLEKAVNTSKSYRGKVLSLDMASMYSGMSNGITVHKLSPVSQDDVILPKTTRDALDRNVINFAKQRSELVSRGQSTKKGLLFYGPPGTGKTHTIKYLASNLSDHTTLLVTAEQVGILDEYFSLARLLQPSILVIEDVDLIAKARETINSPCEEALLNKLLNEMDGLKEDAEVFFVLTTNRPDTLEDALASRPGRIDQAIEFPLPDEAGREKLVNLYSAGLNLDEKLVKVVVNRTENVSGAFIKELMRRSTQYSLDRGDGDSVIIEDIESALEEMLFSGGVLNTKLLGGENKQDQTH